MKTEKTNTPAVPSGRPLFKLAWPLAALALACCWAGAPVFAAEPSQHIMYRSRMEAEVDNFWWEFFTSNPWAVWVIGGIAAAFFLLVVGMQVSAWRSMRDFRRKHFGR